jgi:hypothetical protein
MGGQKAAVDSLKTGVEVETVNEEDEEGNWWTKFAAWWEKDVRVRVRATTGIVR